MFHFTIALLDDLDPLEVSTSTKIAKSHIQKSRKNCSKLCSTLAEFDDLVKPITDLNSSQLNTDFLYNPFIDSSKDSTKKKQK